MQEKIWTMKYQKGHDKSASPTNKTGTSGPDPFHSMRKSCQAPGRTRPSGAGCVSRRSVWNTSDPLRSWSSRGKIWNLIYENDQPIWRRASPASQRSREGLQAGQLHRCQPVCPGTSVPDSKVANSRSEALRRVNLLVFRDALKRRYGEPNRTEDAFKMTMTSLDKARGQQEAAGGRRGFHGAISPLCYTDHCLARRHAAQAGEGLMRPIEPI